MRRVFGPFLGFRRCCLYVFSGQSGERSRQVSSTPTHILAIYCSQGRGVQWAHEALKQTGVIQRDGQGQKNTACILHSLLVELGSRTRLSRHYVCTILMFTMDTDDTEKLLSMFVWFCLPVSPATISSRTAICFWRWCLRKGFTATQKPQRIIIRDANSRHEDTLKFAGHRRSRRIEHYYPILRFSSHTCRTVSRAGCCLHIIVGAICLTSSRDLLP